MDTSGPPTAGVAAGSTTPTEAPVRADPGAQMRLAMPVVAEQGGRLGTLVAWHMDPLTRRMTELTVRHGFLRRRFTRIPMGDMTRVSDGKLVLAHGKAAFKQLPGCDGPTTQR